MKVTFKTGSEVNYGSTNGELFFASNTKQIMLNGIKYIPKKLSELINDSGFITSITKSMVEGVLTGNITSHTHSYLPLTGGTLTGNLTCNDTIIATSFNGSLNGTAANASKLATHSITDLVYRTICPTNATGVLIETDIAAASNTMVNVHIWGNSYFKTTPIDTYIQFYNYKNEDTIIQYGCTHLGYNLGDVYVFIYKSLVHIWFDASGTGFPTINAFVGTNKGSDISETYNHITSLTKGSKPTSGISREKVITPKVNAFTDSNVASASKLGTSTVGSDSLPIYLNNGTATVCNGSSLFSNLSNSGNSISMTIAGVNKTLAVGYAASAGRANSAAEADGLTTTRYFSCGGAVTSGSAPFNGTQDVAININTVKEAYLTWGGKNISGSISPLDAALSSFHSANRLAFANPGGVIVEYSRDGGATWIEYPIPVGAKTNLISGIGSAVYVGGTNATAATTKDQLRITLVAQKRTDDGKSDTNNCLGIYTCPRKLLLNVSTSGATGCTCKVERAKGESPTTFIVQGTYDISGWTHWNSIPIDSAMYTFGGSVNQTDNWWVLRLTFSIGAVNTNSAYNSRLSIQDIQLFGDTYWRTQSSLATSGHMYTWDYNKNVAFPAKITSSGFVKSGLNDSYVLLAGGGHKAESSLSVGSAYETVMLKTACSIKVGNTAKSFNGTQSSLSWSLDEIGAAAASHNHDTTYLKLSGGTMSNTSLVTNLNADLLDGRHAASFYQQKDLRSDQNSIYDLRYNYGTYDKGDYNGTYKDEYPTGYGAYLALTYKDNNIGALMFFDAPTSNVLGHIYVKTRGAGNGNTTYSEWGTLAYLTDNVASSSKWANARTITLTGSVTGSVSIDGSANVSLDTALNLENKHLNVGSITAKDSITAYSISATNLITCGGKDVSLNGHTHTFASLESKPTTLSGYGITDALENKFIVKKLDYQRYVILLCKIGTNTTNKAHTINGMFYSHSNGAQRYQAAYVNIHSADWSLSHNEYYGFTPFGLGGKCRLVTCIYQDAQYLAITFENTSEVNIYFDGSSQNILFTPILYYTENTQTINNSEIYNSIADVTYNKTSILSSLETALTSSNYNSYSPKLDGTGATGTWGISISGNANYATKAGVAYEAGYIITEGDNRSVATTPNDYSNNFVLKGLKFNSQIGSPTTDTYSYLLGLRGWYNSSGGQSHELAFNDSGIYRRQGATTEWGSWAKMLDSDNYASYALPLSGGTLTGALTVPTLTATGGILLGDSSLSAMVGSVGIQRYDETGFIGFLKDFNLDNSFNGVVLGWDGNYSLQENSVRINASTFTYKGNNVWHSGNLKLGYISSGLSRAVQKDSSNNLYVVAPSLFEQGISNNYPKNLRWITDDEGQLVFDTEETAGVPSTVQVGIPVAHETSKGFMKSISTVTDVTGYTPCPVVSGTPYYKLDTIELDYTDFFEIGSGSIEDNLSITNPWITPIPNGGSLEYLLNYGVNNIPRLLTIDLGGYWKYFFWLQQTDDESSIVAYYHCQFNDLWLVIDSPNMEVRISQGSF